eukprot:m.61079 g.61079  ORF g.61079 m.61079 type:complete len:67 (-) comp7322_c0_seq4:945-1145(-)
MTELFAAAGIRCAPTGLQHGTVTIVVNGTHYEISTLRIDPGNCAAWRLGCAMQLLTTWSQCSGGSR